MGMLSGFENPGTFVPFRVPNLPSSACAGNTRTSEAAASRMNATKLTRHLIVYLFGIKIIPQGKKS
jgi:hypothetical protein